MKTCSKCKQQKPVTEFYKNSAKPDGLQYNCKSCKTKYNQSHYINRTEYYQEKANRHRKVYSENRQLVWNYLLANPCMDCGETDPIVLEFDHRDKSMKRYNISQRIASQTWLGLKKEIDKCDVRCANCHRRRTAKQQGYYLWLDDVHRLC